MLTALDIYNLVLASHGEASSLVDPFTGELLDLNEASFSDDDYIVPYPETSHIFADYHLMTNVISWVHMRNADKACKLGAYIQIIWEGQACQLRLVDVHHGQQAAEEAAELRGLHRGEASPLYWLEASVA